MSEVGYLVDTSALTRLLRDPTVRRAWRDKVAAGVLAVCPLIELEIMTSAQSKADGRALRSLLDDFYRWVLMPDGIFDRAMEVQDGMLDRGAHRSAGAVDLLVAATAKAHGLTLLHYDHDFEQVAKVTGQEVQWLAEPGSIN